MEDNHTPRSALLLATSDKPPVARVEQALSAFIPAPSKSTKTGINDIQNALGIDRTAMASQLEESKPSYSLGILKGGTVLGAAFSAASPFLQAVKPASYWQSFKANAPKAAGVGLVMGAAINGTSIMVQRAGIERLKKEYTENSQRGL